MSPDKLIEKPDPAKASSVGGTTSLQSPVVLDQQQIVEAMDDTPQKNLEMMPGEAVVQEGKEADNARKGKTLRKF